LIHTLSALTLFLPKDSTFLVVDNGSFDLRFKKLAKYLGIFLPKWVNVPEILYSDINSLSHAWNMALSHLLYERQCSSVILLNQDVLPSRSVNMLGFLSCLVENTAFGPLSNSSTYQPLQQSSEEAYRESETLTFVRSFQGFCIAANRAVYELAKTDDGSFFAEDIEWNYNEEDWAIRLRERGGRLALVHNAYMIHTEDASWRYVGLTSSRQPDKRLEIRDICVALEHADLWSYLLGAAKKAKIIEAANRFKITLPAILLDKESH
jgi:hypothetical protein